MAAKPPDQMLHLPDTVAAPADILRLKRELESLDEYLRQQHIRQPKAEPVLPKTTRMLDDIVRLNKLDMRVPETRKKLSAFLTVLHTKAPLIHISFSVEPSSAFMAKIVNWLRRNVSPFVLVQVGRQPTIGGGCVVRTANKQFDFSFRQYLTAHKDALAGALAKVATQPEKAGAISER